MTDSSQHAALPVARRTRSATQALLSAPPTKRQRSQTSPTGPGGASQQQHTQQLAQLVSSIAVNSHVDQAKHVQVLPDVQEPQLVPAATVQPKQSAKHKFSTRKRRPAEGLTLSNGGGTSTKSKNNGSSSKLDNSIDGSLAGLAAAKASVATVANLKQQSAAAATHGDVASMTPVCSNKRPRQRSGGAAAEHAAAEAAAQQAADAVAAATVQAAQAATALQAAPPAGLQAIAAGEQAPVSAAAAPRLGSVPVVCGNLKGQFQPGHMTVTCLCSSCTEGQQQHALSGMPAAMFEHHAGLGHHKKWKKSIRVLQQDGKAGVPIGSWLQQHGPSQKHLNATGHKANNQRQQAHRGRSQQPQQTRQQQQQQRTKQQQHSSASGGSSGSDDTDKHGSQVAPDRQHLQRSRYSTGAETKASESQPSTQVAAAADVSEANGSDAKDLQHLQQLRALHLDRPWHQGKHHQQQQHELVSVATVYAGKRCYIVKDAQHPVGDESQQQQRHQEDPSDPAAATVAAGNGAAPEFLFTHWRPNSHSWRSVVVLPAQARRVMGPGSRKIIPISNMFRSAAVAARVADLAQLAILGVWKGMKLNFPLDSYTADEQTPRTGLALMQYIQWLKQQARASWPAVQQDLDDDSYGQQKEGITQQQQGGSGKDLAATAAAAAVCNGISGRNSRQQQGMIRTRQGLLGTAALAKWRAEHCRHQRRCGLCTGCLSGRGCVVAAWRKKTASRPPPLVAASSSSLPAQQPFGVPPTAAAAISTAAQRAEESLYQQQRRHIALLHPEAVQLVVPLQPAAAAVAAVAAAAGPTVLTTANHNATASVRQRQQQARSTMAAAAGTGANLGQYGGLPQKVQADPPTRPYKPTPRPGHRFQQRMSSIVTAAEIGLAEVPLDFSQPEPQACRVCLSLHHLPGHRGFAVDGLGLGHSSSKCPVYDMLLCEPAVSINGSDEANWVMQLGVEGVQLVGALREMADGLLGEEVNRIREAEANKYRMRRLRQRQRQQGQLQHADEQQHQQHKRRQPICKQRTQAGGQRTGAAQEQHQRGSEGKQDLQPPNRQQQRRDPAAAVAAAEDACLSDQEAANEYVPDQLLHRNVKGLKAHRKLGINPWSFVAIAVLLQEVSRALVEQPQTAL